MEFFKHDNAPIPTPAEVELAKLKVAGSTQVKVAALRVAESGMPHLIKGAAGIYSIKIIAEELREENIESKVSLDKIRDEKLNSMLDAYNTPGTQEVKNLPISTSPFDIPLFDSIKVLMLNEQQLSLIYCYHLSLIVISVVIMYLLIRKVKFFKRLQWLNRIWIGNLIFCSLSLVMIKIGAYRAFLDWLLLIETI